MFKGIRFGKMDVGYLKVNQRVIAGMLMAVFLIIGISFIFVGVHNDVEAVKQQLYKENEVISNQLMLDMLILESQMDKEISFIESVDHLYYVPAQSPDIHITQYNRHWEGYIIDSSASKLYLRGQGVFDDGDGALSDTIANIANYAQQIHFPNSSGTYFFHSNDYDFDMVYPFGGTRQDFVNSPSLVNAYLDSVKTHISDPNKRSIKTFFVGDTVYWWKKNAGSGLPSYSGYSLEGVGKSLTQVSDLVDTIHLYCGDDEMIIKGSEEDHEVDIDSLGVVNYTLKTKTAHKQLYHYKKLNNDIMYVTSTHEDGIYLRAIYDNDSLIVLVFISFLIFIIGYIYNQRHRHLMNLEMEYKEQEMKKSIYKSRLGYIMNTIAEAFIRADDNYRITEVNQAAADMFGYRAKDMLGKKISELIVGQQKEDLDKDHSLTNRYEAEFEKYDGSSFFGLVNRSSIVRDNDGNMEHYIMVTDISPIIEAQLKAEEANKSKSRFIANLSHEIRTPMNATIGYIYLLEQTRLTEVQKKYLEKMDYASNSLLEIIDEILDFSKIEADSVTIEKVSFNLTKVLMNSISMFENTAFRKDIKFEVNIDDHIPMYVVSDPYRFRQIIVNLLSNAFKFTEEGHVSITASLVKNKTSRKTGRQAIRIIIEDTGIGIAKERMESLFEPFVQADESTTRLFGGTGLGLSICKKLVNLMQGSISVKSIEGQGSSFTIDLPITLSDSHAIEVGQVKQTNILLGRRKSNKILIVEDNTLNQELLVELLRQTGNKVVVANNGRIAEDILASTHKTVFDIVLMDIQMPVQDGYMTAEKIRQNPKYQHIPIIAVTANADNRTKNRILESGMNGYLLKPINANDLYAAINRWGSNEI